MSRIRNLLSPVVHRARRIVEHLGEIAPGTALAASFGSFGEASCIGFPQATLAGVSGIHVGRETLIGRHCTLTVGYDDLPGTRVPERGLVIGDRCVLGAYTTITAHESVTIEDDVWFGQGVFVSDASHGYQDTVTPIGRQLGEHAAVRIGAGSWIGHGAMVLPGADIGRHCVVAAGAVVRGVVPDYTVVAGVPARTVRELVPGVGWVGIKGDVRAATDPEEIAEFFASLGEPQT